MTQHTSADARSAAWPSSPRRSWPAASERWRATTAAGALKSGLTVYFIPKDTLNPYEVIADRGGKLALDEIGNKQVVSSGTQGHRRRAAAGDPDRDPDRRQRHRDRRQRPGRRSARSSSRRWPRASRSSRSTRT